MDLAQYVNKYLRMTICYYLFHKNPETEIILSLQRKKLRNLHKVKRYSIDTAGIGELRPNGSVAGGSPYVMTAM